jgi:hypothetical protein
MIDAGGSLNPALASHAVQDGATSSLSCLPLV